MRVIFNLAITITATCAFLIALSYQIWIEGRPGEGFFPLLISGTLILLSSINIILDIRKERNKESLYLQDTEKKSKSDIYFELKDLVIVLILIAFYMILFNILGYIISTLVFMIAILFYLKPGSAVKNILISILLVVVIYTVFDYTLNTGLPKGTL
ncbi:tripartite tricarboxylate transporter TctB family protein [Nosocomiicoccus sp. HMSC059G07]|uniref:tripartite tricarboxylate transporter TctB family protein n=1 Tax=Nosocomiicoccus sp. HMSC059G07 TaxID=1739531 RepID=UPI0008A262FA|nr:tripartite tricarboxylate transporter TctB family protein [Nosocomiicoccus sp. HMSC059G07]OFO49080.1 hypothetical protein HMPREF3029_02745 [Nosocomiicoccus sp. HMSC059G07]